MEAHAPGRQSGTTAAGRSRTRRVEKRAQGVGVVRAGAAHSGNARPARPGDRVAILLLILGYDHLQQFFVLGKIALWVAVIAAVASGIDYYRRFNHVLAVQKIQSVQKFTEPS